MTKSDLAKAAGVSSETLRRWLKDDFIVSRMEAAVHAGETNDD